VFGANMTQFVFLIRLKSLQPNAVEAKQLADWILFLGKKNETWPKNKQELYCLSTKVAEGHSVQ